MTPTESIANVVDAASGGERWAHWPRHTESTYYPQFYTAMRRHGIVTVPNIELTREWLASRQADAIHVHWPDGLWRQRGKGLFARLRGVRHVRQFLRSAKDHGLRLIWSVHNLGAHEGNDWVDERGYAVVARLADLIICHSRWSAEEVRRIHQPSGNVVVVPRGNADGYYPVTQSRDVVLSELGLDPQRPVVSCLGLIRAYKGLELACEAISRLGGNVQLLIAGPVHKFDLDPIRTSVAGLPHVRLVPKRLTDEEFANVTAASDATLLPYSNITTSAVLLTSWSLGTGVVVSDLPYFREMLPKPSAAGRLFRAGDIDGLAVAIQDYLRVPREMRTAAARDEARKYTWDRCVEPLAAWLAQHRQAQAARRVASVGD